VRPTSGVRHPGGHAVDSRSARRTLLGVHVTAQVVAFVLAVLVLTVLVGLAVLTWLERTA
jgi:hypothetical protein